MEVLSVDIRVVRATYQDVSDIEGLGCFQFSIAAGGRSFVVLALAFTFA